jgi:glycosyltransferase involved in cell wall biosynthesis
MSTVDVVIPFYNTPIEFTRQTLQSVVAQTHQRWRTYIVNDGSNDASTAALNRLIDDIADERVSCIRTPNRRMSAARNTAIASGSSPYIAMLDSDDYWYPDKLERQIAVLDRHPEFALAYSGNDTLLPNGTIVRPTPAARVVSQLPQAAQIRAMLRKNFIGIVTAVVRRTTLEAIGGFDEVFEGVEDKELWVRLLLSGYRATFLDAHLAVYRQHANGVSGNPEAMLAGRLRLIRSVDALLERVGDQWPDLDWPSERRRMLAHAHHEAAEGALERGSYRAALRHICSVDSGFSPMTARLALRAVYGAAGRPLGRP